MKTRSIYIYVLLGRTSSNLHIHRIIPTLDICLPAGIGSNSLPSMMCIDTIKQSSINDIGTRSQFVS